MSSVCKLSTDTLHCVFTFSELRGVDALSQLSRAWRSGARSVAWPSVTLGADSGLSQPLTKTLLNLCASPLARHVRHLTLVRAVHVYTSAAELAAVARGMPALASLSAQIVADEGTDEKAAVWLFPPLIEALEITLASGAHEYPERSAAVLASIATLKNLKRLTVCDQFVRGPKFELDTLLPLAKQLEGLFLTNFSFERISKPQAAVLSQFVHLRALKFDAMWKVEHKDSGIDLLTSLGRMEDLVMVQHRQSIPLLTPRLAASLQKFPLLTTLSLTWIKEAPITFLATFRQLTKLTLCWNEHLQVEHRNEGNSAAALTTALKGLPITELEIRNHWSTNLELQLLLESLPTLRCLRLFGLRSVSSLVFLSAAPQLTALTLSSLAHLYGDARHDLTPFAALATLESITCWATLAVEQQEFEQRIRQSAKHCGEVRYFKAES